MLNKNTYGAKKAEANQKQQLFDYGYIAIYNYNTFVAAVEHEIIKVDHERSVTNSIEFSYTHVSPTHAFKDMYT